MQGGGPQPGLTLLAGAPGPQACHTGPEAVIQVY